MAGRRGSVRRNLGRNYVFWRLAWNGLARGLRQCHQDQQKQSTNTLLRFISFSFCRVGGCAMSFYTSEARLIAALYPLSEPSSRPRMNIPSEQ